MKIELPHLDPVRFAQDVIRLDGEFCEVSASFPYPPTLPMLVEAAAQGSAGFAKTKEDIPDVAFLVMLKGVSLKQKPQKEECRIHLNKEQDLGDLTYYSFKTYENDCLISEGSFAIAISK